MPSRSENPFVRAAMASALLFLPSLSVSAPAAAQPETAQPATESGTSRSTPGQVRGAQTVQQIAGKVERVDMARGKLVVRTAEGEVSLRARPDRLDELSRGDDFEGSYALYGEKPWLTEERNPGVELSELGSTRSLGGFVHSWDAAEGRLTVTTGEGSTRTFHIHPEETEALTPGRQVSVLYVSVRGEEWVVSVRDRALPTPRP